MPITRDYGWNQPPLPPATRFRGCQGDSPHRWPSAVIASIHGGRSHRRPRPTAIAAASRRVAGYVLGVGERLARCELRPEEVIRVGLPRGGRASCAMALPGNGKTRDHRTRCTAMTRRLLRVIRAARFRPAPAGSLRIYVNTEKLGGEKLTYPPLRPMERKSNLRRSTNRCKVGALLALQVSPSGGRLTTR